MLFSTSVLITQNLERVTDIHVALYTVKLTLVIQSYLSDSLNVIITYYIFGEVKYHANFKFAMLLLHGEELNVTHKLQ